MRFQEVASELIHHEDAARALRDGFRLVWVIREETPAFVSSGERREFVPGVYAELRLARHGDRIRPLVAITDRYGVDNGAHYAFMTADELRTFADIREAVDRWVAGEIAGLPLAIGRARRDEPQPR